MIMGGGTNEFYYSKIIPKIVCEKFLDGEGKSLIDYKLHCINGEPQFFLVCSERDIENSKLTLTSYTKEWDKKDYLKTEGNQMQKPKELDKIIEYAKILSEDFPYVRADFYEVNGRVYFGELTFTPAANNMYYYKESVLEMMGDKLVLPEEKIEGNW